MVYVSIKKIAPSDGTQSVEKIKSWRVITESKNTAFIDSLLSRKNAASKQNSIEAYTLLDLMLSSLTDIKNAVLRRGENGKPYIENKKISFNLTHTEGAVACILDTEGGDVGIDCERIGRDGKKIIERFFDENAKRRYTDSHDKALEFARIWTEKESYVKFTGEGLSDYSTVYPLPCKFTHLRDGDLLITACTRPDATVRIWQNDEDVQ